jgi:serine/threonine-protein kinase PknG
VVLITEFRGYQTRYVASLPPVAETPVFAEHDSLYRLIAKACALDPADRFASVGRAPGAAARRAARGGGHATSGTALTSAASVLFEAPRSPARRCVGRAAGAASRHHRPRSTPG